jgi:hypothetical protein
MLILTRRVRETVAIGDDVAPTIVRWLWRAACLPVLMLLVILEPLGTFVLAALALLGLLTTLFFYLVGPPEFPVWTMLALSLGFAIALVPYDALIRLLSSLLRYAS